ncbi:MAG: fibrobacter succinogenes major paralogous domain-containing protein [Marinilabiliaceae bacterium]|nr:fibrobacter succinogenes major paralogous domain-containing protein [Marinilabiliaceae bacterium]
MKLKLLFYSALAVMLAVSSCKEEPSQIPTVPTTLSLEDGAEITDLKVTLSANGSTVEDESLIVSYVYYIGKSADALEETTAEVTLEPYTQYFWCAQAKTEGDEGERTEVRTFYCVPNLLELTTDNGDGEYAAIIKWNMAETFQSVTVTATANHEGYELEPQTISSGVDSCCFSLKRNASDPTKDNAFVQYWDDEHGIYAEPVVYDFKVEAKIQVGDKTFTLTKSAKECILDKKHVVRDREFNVYRVVKIGSQTWLADDFRVTKYYDGSPIEYVVSELPTGATGLLYRSNTLRGNELLAKVTPKGYHISTNEDWLQLEEFYGITSNEVPTSNTLGFVISKDTTNMEVRYREKIVKESFGIEQRVGYFLESAFDWAKTNDTNQTGESFMFNAKPFGYANYLGHRACYEYASVYGTPDYGNHGRICRIIWAYSSGILRSEIYGYFDSGENHYPYVSVRLVKD